MDEVVSKLQQGKQQMAARCRAMAERYTPEGWTVSYRKSLSGRACFGTQTLCAPEPKTRKSLYIFLHECGHVHLSHDKRGKPAHRREYEAEMFAHRVMRENGLAVPQAMTDRAKAYVQRKIRQAERRGAKRIDPEARRWANP